MKNDLFISVMICCYNSEQYLRETIDSVIDQTYTNWEIVIVNDGSTDCTEEIIFDYIEQGIPISYLKQENKGFGAARNKAIELAKGDWIAIIDHDDICMPNRLESQANDIINNPEAKLFFGNSIHINSKGDFINHQFDEINPLKFNFKKNIAADNLLKYGCFIDSETVIFNKDMANWIGGFNETYKYILDYEFFLRVAENHPLYCSDDILSKWRVHSKQATRYMGGIVLIEHIKLYWHYIKKRQLHISIKSILILKVLKIYVKYFFQVLLKRNK